MMIRLKEFININSLKFLSLILAVISLIIITYRFSNPISLSKPSLFYYSIPTFFIFLFFISNKISKIKSFYISYFLFTSLIFFYSIEASIKFFINKDFIEIRKSYFKKNGLDYRHISEIYDEIKEKKLDKTISVPPQNFLNDKLNIYPLSGISNKETIMCNENGYFNSYFSDRFGFNNNDNIYSKSKISNVILGDSFIHGACVNNQDNLIFHLKKNKHFKNREILNLGYSGNGPLLTFATLIEYFPKKKYVENVFWVYYEGNDLEELTKESLNIILNKYLKIKNFSQNLSQNQEKIDVIVNKKLEESREIYNSNNNYNLKKFISFLSLDDTRSIVYSFLQIKEKKDTRVVKNLSLIFSNAKKFISSNNAELIVIYLPDKSKKKEANLYHDDFFVMLNNLDIKYIDFTNNDFYKKDNNFSKYGTHFNSNGYKEMSNILAIKLSELIPQ